jgi:polyphenol oxidase
VTGGNREGPVVDGAIFCDLVGGGHALFTSRASGNLSTMRGDDQQHSRQAREQLCDDLGLRWLCASRQVHGTVVQRVRSGGGAGRHALAIEADGHATSGRELGMMVLVADCLPVALGSERAVAMLHAGWRGLACGVLEEGVRALHEMGGDCDEIVAVIGPGAGVCCYEVGSEVRAAFGGAHRGGRHIDLRSIARARLLGAGVTRVHDVDVCTICDERFFSHRREGLRAGRQAGVAWLS